MFLTFKFYIIRIQNDLLQPSFILSYPILILLKCLFTISLPFPSKFVVGLFIYYVLFLHRVISLNLVFT